MKKELIIKGVKYRMEHYKDIKSIPDKVRHKVLSILLGFDNDWSKSDVLNLTNLYIYYNRKNILTIGIDRGFVDNSYIFFWSTTQKVREFTILYNLDLEHGKRFLYELDKEYEHILIETSDCLEVPDNFKLQILCNQEEGILKKDMNFIYDNIYISNVEDNFLSTQYLRYIRKDEIDISDISYKFMTSKELKPYFVRNNQYLYPSGSFGMSAAFPLLDYANLYDDNCEFIVGIARGFVISLICIKYFDNKPFFYFVSTRRDLLCNGLAYKAIEYLGEIDKYEILYGTIETYEGSRCKINSKIKEILGSKFIPVTEHSCY